MDGGGYLWGESSMIMNEKWSGRAYQVVGQLNLPDFPGGHNEIVE